MRTLLLFLLGLTVLLPAAASVPPSTVKSLSENEGLSGNNVRCCFQDSRGFLWLGTDRGLNQYDGNSVKLFPRATCCLAESGGIIWVGTEEGLWTYSHEDGKFSHFKGVTAYGVNIISRVNDIAVTRDGLIWAGTEGQGLFLYDTVSGELVQRSVRTPFVERVFPAPDGRIIIADKDGTNHIYSSKGDYIRTTLEALPVRSDTLIDREGTRWIPTSDRGLLKITAADRGTMTFPFPDGAAVDGIVTLAEDPEGTLIIGNGESIYTLSQGQDKCTLWGNISPHGHITQVLALPGEIWVGTDTDCICRIVKAGKSIRHYHTGGTVNVLYRTGRGTLMAGTNLGIFSYNTTEDRLSKDLNRKDIQIVIDGKKPDGSYPKEFEVVSQSSVVAVCEDASGHYLYLATSNRGVFRKNLFTNAWEHLVSSGASRETLPWNKITLLFRSGDGTVWAGTDNEGLWSMDPEDLSFKILTPLNPKLRESRVFSMTEDGAGNLWICTSSGLWRMNPRSGAEEQYNIKAESIIYGTDGKLYMGCRDGVISMLPQTKLTQEMQPPVVIRELAVGDSTVYIPPGGKKITLSHLQNSFTISLAALSFTDPSHNLFSWQLSGIDPDWTTPSNTAAASYSRVPPGEYLFRVQGCDDSLRITIRPPWWKSAWAISLYIIMAVVAFVLILLYWQRRMALRYSAIMKKQEEEREKALYKQRIRFFIGLIHEIRTPLTLIRLQHEKDRPGADDAITRNLDYMQNTISKILTYDKNASGDIEMSKRHVDLRETVSSVTATFKDSAASENIELTCNVGDTPVPVNVDTDMITKILTNLLSNALKYTKDRITITVGMEKDDAVVSVSDNGPGVRKDRRDKIFGMFWTDPDDKVAQSSGIGVGLAYARQLAEAHGGSLIVEDAVPEGASFILRIPVSKDTDARESLPAAATPSSRERLKVLIVEDNRELRETLSARLSEWYDILTAPEGRTALNLIEEKEVDIVVSDVMMPVMDGFELCRSIKGQLAYSHIPVILLTAKVTLEAKSEGMESGADAYVEKPFSIRQLRGQIDNLIRLRESFRRMVTGDTVGREVPSGPEAGFIRAINESIEKQISEEDFSIEGLASDMAMSRTNFFRKFKALTGITPNDYLKNYRLDRAAALIRSGARINEAAESVGFTSSSYFAKCFKARFGVLPKDYSRT